MKSVIFSEGWDDFFKRAGFCDCEAYWKLEGVQVNKNSKREVIYFSIGHGDEKREFFMKRFQNPHLKDIFKSCLTFQKLCSQGQAEWHYAHLLLANGIETYHPVCYGEEFTGLLEKRSFVITEKLQGRCMSDFLKDNWDALSREEKAALFQSMGKLLARVHNSKLSLPDFYLWHIYTGHPEEVGSQLAVIDLHRMRVNPFKKACYAHDVGAFEYSVPDDYMADGNREAFMSGYQDKVDFPTGDSFWEEAERRFKKQRNRRKMPAS